MGFRESTRCSGATMTKRRCAGAFAKVNAFEWKQDVLPPLGARLPGADGKASLVVETQDACRSPVRSAAEENELRCVAAAFNEVGENESGGCSLNAFVDRWNCRDEKVPALVGPSSQSRDSNAGRSRSRNS